MNCQQEIQVIQRDIQITFNAYDIIKVEKYKHISEHPYFQYLTPSQINEIGIYLYDIIYLQKIGKYR